MHTDVDSHVDGMIVMVMVVVMVMVMIMLIMLIRVHLCGECSQPRLPYVCLRWHCYSKILYHKVVQESGLLGREYHSLATTLTNKVRPSVGKVSVQKI